MQCPSCQFENMPGNTSCLRCGAALLLAASAVSVYPKRAAPWVKRVRRWNPLRGISYRWQGQLTGWRAALAERIARDLGTDQLRRGTLARMIVPGWGHAQEGFSRRGRTFFLAWLAPLALGLLTFGSTLGFALLGAAVSVHAGSIINLLARFRQLELRRLALVSLASGVFSVALYTVLLRSSTHVIDSRQWLLNGPVLAPGDVVLFNPRAYRGADPELGDVVLYRNRGFDVPTGERIPHQYRYHRIQGEWIDRVIAGPGAIVEWDHGVLLVDGKPSSLRPLSTASLPHEFEVQVPEGLFCVIPSSIPFLTRPTADELWKQECLVSRQQLAGRAIVRHYPLWRFWWLR